MSVSSALEKVRQLKAGTVSALDAFVDTHESNLVTVTEEEYMASMRDNDFIVDEDGGDYAAGDEVELYSSDETETQPRKKAKLSNNGTLFKHFDKMRSRRTERVVSLDEEMEEFDQAILEPETKSHSPPRASRKLFGRSNLAQLKVDRGLFAPRGGSVSDPKPLSPPSLPIRPSSDPKPLSSPSHPSRPSSDPKPVSPPSHPNRPSSDASPVHVEAEANPLPTPASPKQADVVLRQCVLPPDTEGGAKSVFPEEPESGLAVFLLDVQPTTGQDSVFLIGRLESGELVTLAVSNMQRVLHLVYTDQDPDALEESGQKTFQEFEEIRRRCGIRQAQYCPVVRRTLDLDAGSKEIACLKVKLGYKDPMPCIQKGQHFSAVMSNHTSVLHEAMLTGGLTTPSWVKVQNVRGVAYRYTRSGLQGEIPTLKDVRTWNSKVRSEDLAGQPVGTCNADGAQPPPAPLKLMVVSIATAVQGSDAGVVALLVLVLEEFTDADATTFTRDDRSLLGRSSCRLWIVSPGTKPDPRAQFQAVPSEKALLTHFCAAVCRVDPDILVGHGLAADLNLVTSRMTTLGVRGTAKLSRAVRPRDPPRGASIIEYTAGRVVADTYLLAKELLGSRTNYALATLCQELLPPDSVLISDRPSASELDVCTTPGGRVPKILAKQLTSHLHSTASHCVRLLCAMQAVPLTRELSTLSYFLWSRTLLGRRAERNDYLLSHHFLRAKFLLPQCSDESKGTFSGGLVLDPVVGLYDSFVLLLDFNSLYPSVIREFNVCPSTARGGTELTAQSFSEEPGVLPGILKTLVERRRSVKALLNSTPQEERPKLHVRQLALKLTANSIYGCLGYHRSQFYFMPLAKFITQTGRSILDRTRNQVEKQFNVDVVYGDTDSIMVDTKIPNQSLAHYERALKMGHEISQAVNKNYRVLQLELEDVYGKILLLKKKKYAGVKIKDYSKKIFHTEMKGLDLVRRDWSRLVRTVGLRVLNIMFDEESIDNAGSSVCRYLEEVAAQLDRGEIPLDQFVVTKSLTKAPSGYGDPENLPHVYVALEMLKRGMQVAAGNEIPYIVCTEEGDASKKVALRCRHPSWMAGEKPDVVWYKEHQLRPTISRISTHLPDLPMQRLCHCLGIASPAPVNEGIPAIRDATLAQDLGSYLTTERVAVGYRRLVDEAAAACAYCGASVPFLSTMKQLDCTSCQRTPPVKYCESLLLRYLHQAAAASFRPTLRCPDCHASAHVVSLSEQFCGHTPACDKAFEQGLGPAAYHGMVEYIDMLVESPELKRHIAALRTRNKFELVNLAAIW